MSKQLILITAPFNCGFCKKAQEELPPLCENKGWELIEIEDEQGDSGFPVDTYPTLMIRVNDKMVDTVTGYSNIDQIKIKLNQY
tara:strand:- start:176 stop:427 length:252 start_codon:yes stop_codon:yes gene_type:complete